jgi:uncharacterized protein
MSRSEPIFLTAEWRYLLLLNFEIDPPLLQKYIPKETQLDFFQGKTYVSLVGFRFLATKIRGRLAIPFHSDFEEINLRFYVRRIHQGEVRRGVVFISEIVPRLAVSTTARLCYGENYVCRTMKHWINLVGTPKSVHYSWREAGRWCALEAEFDGQPALPENGSLQQFIAEHYWGYSAQRNGSSMEYHVEHVPWKIWSCTKANFIGNPSNLYGDELSAVLRKPPDSVFLADGSRVAVYAGRKLP